MCKSEFWIADKSFRGLWYLQLYQIRTQELSLANWKFVGKVGLKLALANCIASWYSPYNESDRQTSWVFYLTRISFFLILLTLTANKKQSRLFTFNSNSMLRTSQINVLFIAACFRAVRDYRFELMELLGHVRSKRLFCLIMVHTSKWIIFFFRDGETHQVT